MSDVLTATTVKPRLGFLGVGWIGRNRLDAILEDGCAEAAYITDPNPDAKASALASASAARDCAGLDELLESDVDGIVIATPSGLHAEQAIRVLNAGKAVFCQKPLGRTATEAGAVIEAARRNDRLLAVDLSYRHARAMQAVRDLIRSGAIGDIYGADLIFHNAYGPNAGWSRDRRLAGGGCAIDLGVHLVDLLLWTLGRSDVERVSSALFCQGRRLQDALDALEDYAVARLDFSDGTTARLACSWHHPAGKDAVIEISFHGTRGGATFRNVEGSFYDFTAEIRTGAQSEIVVEPPDSWGGRAAVRWAKALAQGRKYDPEIESAEAVADVLDRIYMEAGRPRE